MCLMATATVLELHRRRVRRPRRRAYAPGTSVGPEWRVRASSQASGWPELQRTPAIQGMACAAEVSQWDMLGALADALRLDGAEGAHLHDLARASSRLACAAPRGRADRPFQRAVDARFDDRRGAFAENGRLDALGANRLGRALYPAVFSDVRRPGNWARFVLLAPQTRALFADWERAANDVVAILRSEAQPQLARSRALGSLRRAGQAERGLPWALGGA
jgi:MmyB-like transcription regulator ligand binding domain